jgi:hypothetical protein
MLLDARGHLKLADFGTCIKMDKVKYFLFLYKYSIGLLRMVLFDLTPLLVHRII